MILILILLVAPAQKMNQYKRIHQSAFRNVLGGTPEQAIKNLKKVLAQTPEDAESHYMLAVAHASRSRLDVADRHAQKAIELGMPADRFVGGTLMGLEKTATYKRLLVEYKQ